MLWCTTTHLQCMYTATLNLALVASVKSIRDFFNSAEALYVFISTTKAHTIFVAKQKQLHPEKQVHQLQKLSDTRWACRQSAICSTYDNFERDKVEATGLSQVCFIAYHV